MHRNLAAAVTESLRQIFDEKRYADKVLERMLKSDPRWGSRDRKFIAETTYNIVRWWRLIRESAGLPLFGGGYDDTVTAWLLLNQQALPNWMKSNVDQTELLQRNQELQTIPAVKESIPDWMEQLGVNELEEEAWHREIHAMNQQAAVVLRVNTLKTDKQTLQRRVRSDNVETQLLPGFDDALLLNERTNVFQLAAFKEGWFEVQDAGSQRIAPFLDAQPGMRVVDACAGAGGKTLHLAALMQNRGKIIAMDVDENKLVELRKRARRAGANIIETRLIDSTKIIKRLHDSADRVLIDAPCSGLGVLRRNPDAKWKLSLDVIEKVKTVQANLLQRYSLMAKRDGKIVYATCSILPSENQQQVQNFLRNNPNGYELEEELNILPSAGFDGFYMARLRRLS